VLLGAEAEGGGEAACGREQTDQRARVAGAQCRLRRASCTIAEVLPSFLDRFIRT
jgi:hypothetical protein